MKKRNKTIVIGILGTKLDSGSASRQDRWSRWRPTVSLCQHEELLIDRYELLYETRYQKLAELVRSDMQLVSPETNVCLRPVELKNWWDFAHVYGALFDFAREYPFDPDKEEYLIHITTGSHVAQICLFLLTEAHWLPGKLLQSEPSNKKTETIGAFKIIDLDLSRYDAIASRFRQSHNEAVSYLKQGIKTCNKAFNRLIDQIEVVAIRSQDPILITGPTGAGKSQLARRIFELRKVRQLIKGVFVEVNSATLRGDQAMSALFGHVKGAYTGAASDRPGLLRKARDGMLFLDEIGDLDLDEQAMLLRALEEKRFLPVGSDSEVESNFQLIAGTNHDLGEDVAAGRFRDDLLARINLWTFCLPGLCKRPEDIEPNIDFELEQYAQKTGQHMTFNKQARERFLTFAQSAEAVWSGNFRDLNGAIRRLGTLSEGGRIDKKMVDEELERLRLLWGNKGTAHSTDLFLQTLLGKQGCEQLDRFDRVQLADVVEVCCRSRSLSDAGRSLFTESRKLKRNSNDADRLRKYLARFGITWNDIRGTKAL